MARGKRAKKVKEMLGAVAPLVDLQAEVASKLPELDNRPDLPTAEGGISEPMVFQMSMYAERITKLKAQMEQVKLVVAQQIQSLEKQRYDHLTNLNHEYAKAAAAYKQVQMDIETKHGIDLKDYAYDDETGTLNKISGSVGETLSPTDAKPNELQ